MEFKPKEHIPRVNRPLSGSTGIRQRIAFFDNRPTNTQSTIQLNKKFNKSSPYDTSMTDDLITMGREVECGNVGLMAVKGTLANGSSLARSGDCFTAALPFIDLQVEGLKRGTPIIEVVYGPVKGSFYVAPVFTTIRMMLYDTLEMASARKLPLVTAIRLFNHQVMSTRASEVFLLTPSSAAEDVTLVPIGTSNARMIQTNLSLPFSILSATDSSKPMMEDLIPAKQKVEMELFAKIREKVAIQCGRYSENIRSLFILVLFQGCMKAKEPETTKQLFSVLVKASPADIIFSLLSNDEVDALLQEEADTEGATLLYELAKIFTIESETVDRLYVVLKQRQGKFPFVLGKAEGDYQEGYTVHRVSSGQYLRVFHDMPRASGRLFNELRVGRVVFELRRSSHPLNKPEDMPLTPFNYLWEQPVFTQSSLISTLNSVSVYNRRLMERDLLERKLSELEKRVEDDLDQLEKANLFRKNLLMDKAQLEEILQSNTEETNSQQLQNIISEITQYEERENSIRAALVDLDKEESAKPIGLSFHSSVKHPVKRIGKKNALLPLGKRPQGLIREKLPPLHEQPSREEPSIRIRKLRLQEELEKLSVSSSSLMMKRNKLESSLLAARKRREEYRRQIEIYHSNLKKTEDDIIKIKNQLTTKLKMIENELRKIKAEDEKKIPTRRKLLLDFLPLKDILAKYETRLAILRTRISRV